MRILVVEDHESVSRFVVKGLTEAGYAVDHVAGGDQVLPALARTPYDLVILDLMLPGLGGHEVLRRMRGEKRNMPVLILTARDRLDDKVQGLDLGADDYLTKPFAFAELLARARALLRRRGERDPLLRIADVEIDLAAHSVQRGGRRLELTAKEFSLLAYLLQNQNRVVTRTCLIEHVWDMHFDSDTNLVDVLVSKLRGKLEAGGAGRLIHTVRGVGYVLREEG